MVASVWTPPNFYPTITAGATWHEELPPFIDTATGGYFNWTADQSRWLLEANIVDSRGQVLAHLASTGARDGDIRGDSHGLLSFDMTATATALLPITRDYVNSTDRRIAGFRHRGVLPFDLVVTDNDTEEVWALAHGLVTVLRSPSL